MRRIEFCPLKEGFEVLFIGFDPSTVEEIKKYSISLLVGMGYEIAIEKSETKQGDGFYFFIFESKNEKIKANNLLHSLFKATKNMKEDK